MELQRSSGVLLHVSSLPSVGGVGDLGPEAHAFLDFLAQAKQHVWQVLPLGPTGYGNSPYAATSAFAGNPLLISLEVLVEWGWIDAAELQHQPGRTGNVDFSDVEWRKMGLLYKAAEHFLARAPKEPAMHTQWDEFEQFCREQASWLADYAFFAELRRQFNTGAWSVWPEPLRRRQPDALAKIAATHGQRLAMEEVLQFAFAKQWNQLRAAAKEKGIRILGDVAIFVNMDSADVWVHPELFELDKDFQPLHVAGVPPDYFSPTGQRWGNPLYRWNVIEHQGWDWWIARMRRARELYDIIRLDHFRGFEAYWSIPASEETAVKGEWMQGPGAGLFQALENALGPLPIVAEDLGIITPQVDALRQSFSMPGMKVMQFGFNSKGAHTHLPQRYTTDTVAYTGTHDNNTTPGWWKTASKVERAAVETIAGPVHGHPTWPMTRLLFGSVACMAIVPVQDLLELGEEARMNTPSVPWGNWLWRVAPDQWSKELAAKLATLTEATDRDWDPLGPPPPKD